jgi:hypothetical protein
MALALGIFDHDVDRKEGFRRLCLCFPDLQDRIEKAKQEYCRTSIFQHYIIRSETQTFDG